MVKLRRTAALAALMPAVAMSVGASPSSTCPACLGRYWRRGLSRCPARRGGWQPGDPGACHVAIESSPPGEDKHHGLASGGHPALRRAGQRLGLLGHRRDRAPLGVGVRRHRPRRPERPVAALWDGSTLTSSVLPHGLTGFISEASAPAANDIWAASQYGRYVLRYDGHRWLVAAQWRRGQITGLTAISGRDVWVFGTTVGG